MGFYFLERKPELASNDANGNDLLNYHREIIDADFYFQLFITSPLLKLETINNCIKLLKENKEYNSIMTVKSIYTWFGLKENQLIMIQGFYHAAKMQNLS